MEGNMAQTKKRSILFVVALAVFAALIVILAATLSACSNDDNDTKEPTPTETAQPEVTTEPASADVSTGKTGDAATTGSMTGSAAKQPTKSPAKSPIKNGGSSTNNSGSKDNGRNKIDYIMNYGDNVEKGVEGAADDFVGSLKGIGNAYDKGDVNGIMNTVGDFSKGLGDFLGGVKDSIIP